MDSLQGGSQSDAGGGMVVAQPAPSPVPVRANYMSSTATLPDSNEEINPTPVGSLYSQRFPSINRSLANSPALNGSPKVDGDIYRATYSGVPVFEMQVNNISVMRRRHDSSLNATQILKVAGVEKSKRTKILEKEILTGVHEKVQGGYGKYQGTWIPYQRAVDLCKQYSVYDALYPLLSFDVDNTGMENTPTKEQAMAAKRSRLAAEFYSNNSTASSNGISASANPSMSPAIGASGHNSMISFARPLQVSSNSVQLATSASAALSSLKAGSSSSSSDVYGGSVQAIESQSVAVNTRSTGAAPKSTHGYDYDYAPAIKKARYEVSTSSSSGLLDDENVPEILAPLDPIKDTVENFERSRELMTQIFMDDGTDDIDRLLLESEETAKINIDVAIDESGHTALHWASALARVQLVRDLVKHDASVARTNYAGETPLVRAVLVTNNSEFSSFSELLDILFPAIPLVDKQGRTLLHHIALTAGIRGRSDASRYYLETLLEWIVRRGSRSKTGRFGLSWFMKEVVNRQDNNGDSALNIAARVGSKHIASQLLDVGADPTLMNRAGLCPLDFGVQSLGREVPRLQRSKVGLINDGARESASENTGTARERRKQTIQNMQSAIEKLDASFEVEIGDKQNLINSMRNQLRNATSVLNERRGQLEHLQEISHKMNEWQQSAQSLERAVEEEDRKFNQKQRSNKEVKPDTDDDSVKSESVSGESGHSGQMMNPVLSLSFEGNFDADQPFRIWPGSDELAKLPTAVLQARIVAYKKNEEKLLSTASELRGRSAELERKFRRVISLCTGVEESKVDGLLKGLVKAVESDPSDVDISRVAGFLRKVDEGLDP